MYPVTGMGGLGWVAVSRGATGGAGPGQGAGQPQLIAVRLMTMPDSSERFIEPLSQIPFLFPELLRTLPTSTKTLLTCDPRTLPTLARDFTGTPNLQK